MNAAGPIGLLQDDADMRRSHRHSVDHFGAYATEILEHAGLPYRALGRKELLGGALLPLVLLPYRMRLSAEEVTALRRHAEAGGAVIAVGGVEGADQLFGITSSRRQLDEGRLHWPAGGLGLEALLAPVWGGQSAVRDEGAEGLELNTGELRDAEGSTGSAFVLRRVGLGVACWLACDVARSVVTMQQGVPVLGDAASAPDGSAQLEDRILKADDGAVIDWSLRDEGPEGKAFLTPYADRLRELLVAVLAECAERTKTVLPMRWYWPQGLPAVAALSYDTDSNEDADGRRFLGVVRETGVNGTWCVMYPGGYERSTYDAIRAHGDEIALHFDGLTTDLNGAPHCGWSQDDFEHQLAWLEQETGVSDVVSQKNHVTRWEGWLELFRWVESSGIKVDQTKGPSKIGNLGFAFGTCHPWRPVEDALNGNRLIDVLELTFHTHDMHHSGKRVALRRALLDVAKRHAGVAHFIFHPQRIHEPGQREAIADVVAYARESGVELWTSERIWRWETARRQAHAEVQTVGDHELLVTVTGAPDGLTLLVFGLPDSPLDLGAATTEVVQVIGRSAHRFAVPQGDSEVRLRLPRP